MPRASTDVPDTAVGSYEPRRSNRVSEEFAQADGDTWKERLAVCEGAADDGKPQLLVRSYFRNVRTGERVWDEPPSGASAIDHATPEMRKEAETQMQELNLTLEMIPADSDEVAADTPAKKKVGFFGRLRGKKEKKAVEVSKDLNLQKAIARSIREQHGLEGVGDEPVVYFESGSASTFQQGQEDDEVALAKALSMSDSSNRLSEEEMLQMALEQSRIEADGSGTASLPAANFPSPPPPPSNMKSPPVQLLGADSEQKMPAKSTSRAIADKFDPLS